MIDRNLFSKDKLLDVLLDHLYGNVNKWMDLVEIIPDYIPPFPRDDTRPTIKVRCLTHEDQPVPGPGVVTSRHSYLRNSICGWQYGGYFWDGYGTAWTSVEHALMAVLHAPVPPGLLKAICWGGK